MLAHFPALVTTAIFVQPASCTVFGDVLANVDAVWYFECSVFDDVSGGIVQTYNLYLVRLFHNSVSGDLVTDCSVSTLVLFAYTMCAEFWFANRVAFLWTMINSIT